MFLLLRCFTISRHIFCVQYANGRFPKSFSSKQKFSQLKVVIKWFRIIQILNKGSLSISIARCRITCLLYFYCDSYDMIVEVASTVSNYFHTNLPILRQGREARSVLKQTL